MIFQLSRFVTWSCPTASQSILVAGHPHIHHQISYPEAYRSWTPIQSTLLPSRRWLLECTDRDNDEYPIYRRSRSRQPRVNYEYIEGALMGLGRSTWLCKRAIRNAVCTSRIPKSETIPLGRHWWRESVAVALPPSWFHSNPVIPVMIFGLLEISSSRREFLCRSTICSAKKWFYHQCWKRCERMRTSSFLPRRSRQ